MARWTEQKRETIDAVVDQWRDECLQGDGSLLFETPLWTEVNLDRIYDRFNKNPLTDDRQFEEKFKEQLGDDADAVRLGAEILGVYFLFTSGVHAGRKRELIGEVLGWIGESFDSSKLLWQAMAEGIGNPGPGFNMARDVQVGFVVDFARRWKKEEPARRDELLADPWALRDFMDESEESLREMRHILLHLLRPDEFERIASGPHKHQIATAYGDLLPEEAPDDLDERLLAIRRRLEELLPDGNTRTGALDFYHVPLAGIWDQSSVGGEGLSSLAALDHKRQLILYGPPGTGKTHKAKALAERVIRHHALKRWKPARYFEHQERLDELVRSHIRRLQLHPAYSYEEFVRGLRLDGDRTAYQNGYLLKLIDEIEDEEHGDGEERLPWVLILDEINRTDVSRLLGEAFSLLEDRESEVELIGGEDGAPTVKVTLPRDLFVIGTMNLIDQSVEQIDFALRRRFLWERLGFEREAIPIVVEARWRARELSRRYPWEMLESDVQRLADNATLLNAEIAGSDYLGFQYEIGHTYFFDIDAFIAGWSRLQAKTRTSRFLWRKSGQPLPPLEDLWARSLQPLLEQYLAGIDAQARDQELRQLRSVLYAGERQ